MFNFKLNVYKRKPYFVVNDAFSKLCLFDIARCKEAFTEKGNCSTTFTEEMLLYKILSGTHCYLISEQTNTGQHMFCIAIPCLQYVEFRIKLIRETALRLQQLGTNSLAYFHLV